MGVENSPNRCRFPPHDALRRRLLKRGRSWSWGVEDSLFRNELLKASRIMRDGDVGTSSFQSWSYYFRFLTSSSLPMNVQISSHSAGLHPMPYIHSLMIRSHLLPTINKSFMTIFLFIRAMRTLERSERPSVNAAITSSFFSSFRTFIGPPWLEIPEGI